MAIPDFPSLMLPILQRVAQRSWKFSDLAEAMADHYQLSAEERKARSSSGAHLIIKNRTGWAVTNLKKAGLITNPTHGVWKATDCGRSFLKRHSDTITMGDLKQLSVPGKHQPSTPAEEPPKDEQNKTPSERIEVAYRELTEALAAALLERIRKISPTAFEQLIIDLLLKMGYGGSREQAAEHLGGTGDGGVDGVIREDALGLSTIYIQARRYAANHSNGAPAVKSFVGALVGNGATKGVYVTTSYFTKEALNFAAGNHTHKVVLIGGTELARLMIEHEIGVVTANAIKIQRIDLARYEDDDPVE